MTTQDALKMATKDYDKSGERTIGVITKVVWKRVYWLLTDWYYGLRNGC